MNFKFFCIRLICIFACLIFGAVSSTADSPPFVSPMFGDNMVLQRGKPNAIWGWAKPGEKIIVEINGHLTTAVADTDGLWKAEILPPAPGGPYTLKISDADRSVEFHEVLVGDVWLCGGQSNMEFGLSMASNGAAEVKSANHPEIRLFIVEHQVAYALTNVLKGSWKICSPRTVAEGGWGGFSAVGYYFGESLQDKLHVPVGLVEDCWGGTSAEAWTSAKALHPLKDFDVPLAEVQRLRAEGGTEYGNYVMHWYDDYDIGLKNNWSAANFDDSSWKTMHIPGGFAELGVPSTPAVCWFRKEISLTNPLPPGKATISLGVIERMDTTFINGQWVGASAWVENPRLYDINPGILKPGTNVIAVRVFKTKPDGGFMSKPDVLYLTLGDGTKIPLAGEWKGALSVDARPPHRMPLSYENWPVMPSVLYNGMLKPVAPLAITGVIWYQGEQNADRAYQYRRLLPALIGDWRNTFGQGDFPFYIVSLPAFMHRRNEPGTDAWAELREAQALTAEHVPNCGLAVTIDTGDPDNIHPKEKKIVGERLAYCALAQTYGEKIPYAGPTYQSIEKISGGLKIHFTHVEGGLMVKGDILGEFSVAGNNRKWHWANAKIEGDTVVVTSPEVPDPVAVRYAWQANPEATLYNGAGLPAVPFYTDDWPEITQNAKPW